MTTTAMTTAIRVSEASNIRRSPVGGVSRKHKGVKPKGREFQSYLHSLTFVSISVSPQDGGEWRKTADGNMENERGQHSNKQSVGFLFPRRVFFFTQQSTRDDGLTTSKDISISSLVEIPDDVIDLGFPRKAQ